MKADSESILQAALGLPEDQRLILAMRLMDSMPDEAITLGMDDPNLQVEIERRFRDTNCTPIPWTQLRDESY